MWKRPYMRLVACALAVPLMFGACGDRCDRVCSELGRRLVECRTSSVSWSDLGAKNRADYVASCRTDWERLRSDLDGWEIELALNECGDGRDVLDTLSCDEVLALYAPVD